MAYLMTDGSVLTQSYYSSQWYRYVPDQFGNYASGTWTQVAASGRLFPERVCLGRAFRWAPRDHRRRVQLSRQLPAPAHESRRDLRPVEEHVDAARTSARLEVYRRLGEQRVAGWPIPRRPKTHRAGRGDESNDAELDEARADREVRLQLRGGMDAAAGRHDPHRRREKRPQFRTLQPSTGTLDQRRLDDRRSAFTVALPPVFAVRPEAQRLLLAAG